MAGNVIILKENKNLSLIQDNEGIHAKLHQASKKVTIVTARELEALPPGQYQSLSRELLSNCPQNEPQIMSTALVWPFCQCIRVSYELPIQQLEIQRTDHYHHIDMAKFTDLMCTYLRQDKIHQQLIQYFLDTLKYIFQTVDSRLFTPEFYDIYIVMLSRLQSKSIIRYEKILKISQLFVQSFPDLRLPYIRRGYAYFHCNEIEKAILDGWTCSVTLTENEKQKDHKTVDDKVILLLKKCTKNYKKYIGLDILAVNKWKSLTLLQKEKHFKILLNIYSTIFRFPCASTDNCPSNFRIIIPGKLYTFTDINEISLFEKLIEDRRNRVFITLKQFNSSHRSQNFGENIIYLNCGKNPNRGLCFAHVQLFLIYCIKTQGCSIALILDQQYDTILRKLVSYYLYLFGFTYTSICSKCDLVPIEELYLGYCKDKSCSFSLLEPNLSIHETQQYLNDLPFEIDSHLLTHNIYKNISKKKEASTQQSKGLHSLGADVSKNIKLIIMCGSQGSGKSYFARRLKAMFNTKNFKILSQDDLGHKENVVNALTNYLKMKDTIILIDRCNPSIEERKFWLDISFNEKNSCIVFMDMDAEICQQRARNRPTHQTLSPLSAASAITSFHKQFENPGVKDMKNGYQSVFTVYGEISENALLQKFKNIADKKKLERETKAEKLLDFYKYPRTGHLVTLSETSTTSDDIIISEEEKSNILTMIQLTKLNENYKITIEEKIDGANLGFSWSEETKQIQVQNRSHYIHSKSHLQFQLINHFINLYHDDLMLILQNNKYILYGEWMYATHSIHYTDLPSLFIAFDLYDVGNKCFLSRSRFYSILNKTKIHTIKQIKLQNINVLDEEVLIRMAMNKRSFYYDGKIEGIMLRIDSEDRLIERSKIVRADFIAGNEHWTKRGVRKNGFLSV